MSHDEAAPLIIALTKKFIDTVRELDLRWTRAFLRFSCFNSVIEIKGSYENATEVNLIDVRKHRELVQFARDCGSRIISALGKEEGIILLITKSNLEYEFKFEYEDKSKWAISKLDGKTGIPVGIE